MSNSKGQMKKKWVEVVTISLLLSLAHCLCAQDKTSVQVKTFDQKLEPYRNIEISINGKDFINMGSKGVAFVELTGSDLPIKAIRVRNDQLEASSWNYSKGILEIIVQSKNYQVIHIVVKDENGEVLPNLKVTFRGRKTIMTSTNSAGYLELPLALDEKFPAAGQFSIDGYSMSKLFFSGQQNVLMVERTRLPVQKPTEITKASNQLKDRNSFHNFDFSNLDSIQSLAVFQSVFRDYDRRRLSVYEQKRLDDKFNELVSRLENSGMHSNHAFVEKITATSFIDKDIKNLLAQAREESQALADQHTEFDKKIEIMNAKLARTAQPDEATSESMINDLTLLERLLIENENRFYKNQNDYRALNNAIKERFFSSQVLQKELTERELQRLQEQRNFRQRLLIISSIVLLLGILVASLIYVTKALRKHKKELVEANAEIQWNRAKEDLVFKRAHFLEAANKELDTFLYRVSEDMRTSVRSIIGLCHVANMTVQDEVTELIRRISETAVWMDQLLKKLSIISEINRPTDFSPVSIAASVDSVRNSLKNEIEASGASFITQCADDLMIETYPNLMNAIIKNMIENAIFYSSLNGTTPRIIVTATYEGIDKLCLRVQDNGIGITESAKAQVFDMFFKGTEQSKGHGLGLYIVQKAVQALSGNVTVESVPHSHTTFTVMLPLTLGRLKQQASQESAIPLSVTSANYPIDLTDFLSTVFFDRLGASKNSETTSF